MSGLLAALPFFSEKRPDSEIYRAETLSPVSSDSSSSLTGVAKYVDNLPVSSSVDKYLDNIPVKTGVSNYLANTDAVVVSGVSRYV
jgi:hypothetical protein